MTAAVFVIVTASLTVGYLVARTLRYHGRWRP